MEVFQVMKDILLTADINMDSISVAMQSDLLYSVNNWAINDQASLTPQVIDSTLVLFSTSQVVFYPSSAQ